ncbi:hypothetical protein EDD21DRAFT_421685 [Dissophora ornata]|nr:hypothetical protein EDD21DRAFT_421685 [Dissophora ornata]
MEIDCMDDEVSPGENTCQELALTSILNVITNLAPFFEFNKSPHDLHQLRYTDAMVLNRSSHEHGFNYGAIYKSEIVDLGDFRIRGNPVLHYFGLGLDAPRSRREKLNKDGLLCIGVTLHEGDPICSYIDDTTGKTSVKKYKGIEEGMLDDVRLLEYDHGDTELRIIHIKFRITRSSISSGRVTDRRVCVRKSGPQSTCHAWNLASSPISSSIATLFRLTFTAADYFRDQLQAARYNYHRSEPMYSSITGEKLKVDISFEAVYYHRY